VDLADRDGALEEKPATSSRCERLEVSKSSMHENAAFAWALEFALKIWCCADSP
jgi:hypothetical protein